MKELVIGISVFNYTLLNFWAGGTEIVRSPELAFALTTSTILGVGAWLLAIVWRKSV
jgi:hypothetical protein